MYRPWGWLDWTLSLSRRLQWTLVGCVGPEQRSIVAATAFHKRKLISSSTLFRVVEPDSPYASSANASIRLRERGLQRAGVKPEIVRLDLLAPISTLDQMCDSFSGPVALDISSLPKRFFFYLLKRLVKNEQVGDLILTYTLPKEYPEGPLAGDYDDWGALPSFRPADPELEKQAQARLIVNVGFLPHGLIAHLSGPAEERKIDLLIPFPAPAVTVRRIWKSVWALRRPSHARFAEVRVAANDLSEAFDVILSLIPQDSNLVSFAPFGPKPISAAMCLYATLASCPVYYAQPKMYRPNYSIGVAQIGREPAVNTYWIKHAGRLLYDLPPARKRLNRRRRRVAVAHGTRA